ncbi:hypothetical protein OIU34_23530 [Pararhizobium sp. BT-229]|uniref:hypothetical protein n=1 Tax=Pararhizobium sp. BT-229 TaxID=2986923 RepID=UPI0021F6E317|nr:hypothetical protein [Pararhizobium sp. BT-229]MCV9964868.1 hypothetical protein [Pararhizobium sp. BT-229]
MTDRYSLETISREIRDAVARKLGPDKVWSMAELRRELNAVAAEWIARIDPVELLRTNPRLMEAEPLPTRAGSLKQVINECAVDRIGIISGPGLRDILVDQFKGQAVEAAEAAFNDGIATLKLLVDYNFIDTDTRSLQETLDNWKSGEIGSSVMLERFNDLNVKIERGLAYGTKVYATSSTIDRVWETARAYLENSKPLADAILIARSEIIEVLTTERSLKSRRNDAVRVAKP